VTSNKGQHITTCVEHLGMHKYPAATWSQNPSGAGGRTGLPPSDDQTSSAVVIEVERYGHNNEATVSKADADSPPLAAERTETPLCQFLTKSISPTVVIEVEDDHKGLTDQDEQEEDTSAEVELSHDQTEGVDGYDDDDFEEEEEHDKENDSVTSNKEQDSNSRPEDDGTNADPAPDYDYMLDIYNAVNADDSVRNEWDLAFHKVREGLGGMTDDRQLIEWVLKSGLELDYGRYIVNAERFGEYSEDRVQPIRVKLSTVEEGREILSRAKNLGLQKDFRGIYIQPFLSIPLMQNLREELEEKLSEIRTIGYPRARIEFWRIVQYDENGEPELLYSPVAHIILLEDRGTNTDAVFDYDYMLRVYNANNADNSVRNEWDLVFHRVRERLGGSRDDRQLIEWVLRTCLGLYYGQHIARAERFGRYFEDRLQPIRVQLSTVEAGREILRRAKNLGLRKEFGRIYIQPYLSIPRLREIREELDAMLLEFRRKGYRATIAFWRIVQYENGEPIVLYTPRM